MTSLSSPTSDQKNRASQFYCNLSAFDPEQRKRYSIMAKDLLSKHLEMKELLNGYGLRFANSRLLFTELSEWATLEQLCCPFLTITLELSRDQGPIWLKLTGEEGVKEFLRAEAGI
jgi:hypothetical protein